MSVIEETAAGEVGAVERASRTTVVGLCGLLLAPVAGTVAALAEMQVLGDVSLDGDPAAFLDRVAASPGMWGLMSVALLVMAVLTMAWVPAVWRVTVRRTPRWAWVAAVVGTLFAGGQLVHLVSWNVVGEALASLGDVTAAQGVSAAMDASWLSNLLFVPYLAGVVLATVFAAVALRRARLVPTWSVIAAVVASVAVTVLGTSNPVMLVAYPALLIAAFVPAVVRSAQR